MTETIIEMKDRHADEIGQLQTSCKHPEESEWLEHHWAICHSSGFSIKECAICGKEVDRREGCHKCGKEMTGYDWVEGWDVLKEIRDKKPDYNRDMMNIDFDILANAMYCNQCSEKLIQEKSQ